MRFATHALREENRWARKWRAAAHIADGEIGDGAGRAHGALVSAGHDCRFTILGGCEIEDLVALARHGFKDVTFRTCGGIPRLPEKADVVWAPQVRQEADLKSSAVDASRVLRRGGKFIASLSGFGVYALRGIRETLKETGFEVASIVGDLVCWVKRTELGSRR